MDPAGPSARHRPAQLSLDLELPLRQTLEDFLLSAGNQKALDAVLTWPDWPASTLAVYGPEGAGKTHLGSIAAQHSGATILPANQLGSYDWSSNRHVVLEDGPVGPDDEDALFHLINWIREAGGSLLVLSRPAPAQWEVTLPDLRSRLRAMVCVEIKAPDEVLLEQVLTKNLLEKSGVVPKPEVLNFIAGRMPRSFAAAQQIAELLNAVSLQRAAPITIPLVKAALNW